MAVGKAKEWCERHWGLVLATKGSSDPINGVSASLLIRQALLDDERFRKATGMRDGGPRVPAEKLNAELEKLAPVCCWLGEEKMQEIFAKSRKSSR